jgi:hypothetical protein
MVVTKMVAAFDIMDHCANRADSWTAALRHTPLVDKIHPRDDNNNSNGIMEFTTLTIISIMPSTIEEEIIVIRKGRLPWMMIIRTMNHY